MKLHQNIIDSIIRSLKQIFIDNYYADDTVRYLLQSNPKWGSSDRRFIAQSLYTIVRWWRRYEYIAETAISDPLCFEKVFSVYLNELYGEILTTPLPFNLDQETIIIRTKESKEIRAVEASIPDWLDHLGAEELGEELWERELTYLNKEADVFIRINTLKKNSKQVIAVLESEGITTEPYGVLPETLKLAERKPLQRLASYLDGSYEIQDAGSQLIAHYLSPGKNSYVIDACAGAGGKSLHLAALMQNKGQILSMDIEVNKLKELERRAKRASVSIIEIKGIENGTIDSLHQSADFLLLDVPCSGVGVLRRNPDDKWKLSPERLKELTSIQHEIIQKYSGMLKPGGVLVYATCSILPSENDKQIVQFLEMNKQFYLEKKQTVYPSQGSDGYFMARLIKRP
ncbi:MAG: RsmB/NOP family class I SAM-dependent RNA methyltransferase [Cytophagales bacterium]|nr:RsmB/NOP family class I SAM-dependent RNA methyltransferase [Cytophaga sp.]